MASLPRKKGGNIGRRKLFSGFGSADAGRPGTKTELRTAKHNVMTKQCTATSANGHRCQRPKGHDGYHRINKPTGAAMQTGLAKGKKVKSQRYTPRG
jgi:hypothetical protein